MNGVGTRKASVTSDYSSRHGSELINRPSANAMLDGYTGSHGYPENGIPRSNQVWSKFVQNNDRRGLTTTQPNGSYNRASEMLNPSDPVTMHLLMETAMGDSQQYEVLSFEEADELKKELPILSSRIDATKRKLAIESKVRDAATSINRLDGPVKSGRRGTGSRGAEKPEDGIAAVNRKCEDLAKDLWRLEKRQQDVQRRLLEHTAGILQMTHKGFLEKEAPIPQDGINGYMNGHDGLDLGHFDDQSFYQTLDSMLDEGQINGTGSAAFKRQTQAILETEQKLWDLNRQLKDAITEASSGRSAIPAPPEPEAPDQSRSDNILDGQLLYLEQGINKLQKSQIDVVQSHKKSTHATEERLEDLNTQLRGIVLRSSRAQIPQYPLPPDVMGQGPNGQIAFLESGLDALEQGVSWLKEEHESLSTRSSAHEESIRQYESTLQTLWRNMSEGEKFSLDSFSSKISTLNTRVGDLTNQKDILNRQIQQQRELNTKSEDEKDAKHALVTTKLAQVTAELENTRKEMQESEADMVRLQTELTVARAELDGAYGTRAQRAAEVAQHPALQQEISDLKRELETAKANSSDSAELQQRAQILQKELSETIAEYEVMTKSSIEFEKERETLENTIDGLRDRYEALETQLNEDRVNKLGVKSPGDPGDRGSNEKGATSTSVLKNEFKKMMRETRAENMRALRVQSTLVSVLLRLTLYTARTRRASPPGGSVERAQERADAWEVVTQPEHDCVMSTDISTLCPRPECLDPGTSSNRGTPAVTSAIKIHLV